MTKLLSVFIKPFTYSLEEQMQFAQYAGFDGVDYIAGFKDLFFPPKEILSLSRKYKIPVKGVHIPLPLVVYTPDFLLNNIDNMLSYFPDNEIFNFHLSGFINQVGKNFNGIKLLRSIVKKHKIKFSCESNPNEYIIFKYYPRETRDPDSFAQFCMNQKIPINLDVCHIAAWDYNIVDFFKKYQANINLIHLSDMTPRVQHLPLGEGDLPIDEFLREIKKVSYKGVIVFEVSSFSNAPIVQIKDKLKRNLDLLNEFKID